MEALLLSQKVNQMELESFLSNLKKTPKTRRNEGNLTKQASALDEIWKQIKATNRSILEIYDPAEHHRLPYFSEDVFLTLQENYFNAHGVIFDFLRPFAPAAISDEVATNQGLPLQTSTSVRDRRDIPLPTINIPTFSGGYQSWVSFRDLFEGLIHTNKSLSDVQKMHYLHSCVSGEAKMLIRHLKVSEVNYTSAWELLTRRYQNERALLDAQLHALIELPAIKVESATAIKTYHDDINACIEGLKTLNVNVNSWDPVLIFLLTKKLHRDSICQWELLLNGRADPFSLPSLDEFLEFLEGRFRTLDAINRSSKGSTFNKEQVSKSNNSASRKEPFSARAFVTGTHSDCPICNKDHRLRQCPKFLKMIPKQRYDYVRKNGRCINCLGKSHSVRECTNQSNCQYCEKRHNTMLHFPVATSDPRQRTSHVQVGNRAPGSSQNIGDPVRLRSHCVFQPDMGHRQQSSELCDHPGTSPLQQSVRNVDLTHREDSIGSGGNNPVRTYFAHRKDQATVLLATAIVSVQVTTGASQRVRVLLDQGSQASFITEDAAQRLRLPRRAEYVTISSINDTHGKVSRSSVNCALRSLCHPTFLTHVKAYVLPKITGLTPHHHWNHGSLPYLADLRLADPKYLRPGTIDMLLGADVFAEALSEGVVKGPVGYPVAQNTMFGWIVSGGMPADPCALAPTLKVTCNTAQVVELEGLLRKFWEVEELPSHRSLTQEEQSCERIFEETHYRRPDGRYVVPLTFKGNQHPQLGNSRLTAEKRLRHLEKRFSQDDSLKQQYKAFMQEYVALGHMEKVVNDESVAEQFTEYFLPHHAVLKESSTTTKLRVVFDASSRSSNGKSLNDLLLAGPRLQQDLCDLLLRWRKHRVAITADIEKMYRQILIHPTQHQYQKILWREEPDQRIDTYKLLTVTYGTTCAPYLAVKTLKQLALDEQARFPAASSKVLTDFYVDDLMTGADTVEEAVCIQQELRELLRVGGFNLRKWASNSDQVLNCIPVGDREVNVPFELEFEDSVKALGIHWNPMRDTFGFKVSLEYSNAPVTKRAMLSQASRLFDPLGWLAPTMIVAKILFQKLWVDGTNWDDVLPPALHKEWIDYRGQLSELALITIPRYIGFNRQGPSTIELHAFCDASAFAYAAVVYSCCTLPNGTRTTTLLAAKTKVAPIKQISIPRLELCGAQLLTNLVTKVKTALDIADIPVYGWTDSLIVLAWLRGHPRQWQTFVGNRVSHIQETRSIRQWNYVKSSDNPADCASRGIPPTDLKDHPLWWSGPMWLRGPKSEWPASKLELDTDLERKKVIFLATKPVEMVPAFFNRFSSVHRLLRVVSYCFRFINNTRRPRDNRTNGELTIAELDAARTRLEYLEQRFSFSEDILKLEAGQTLEKTSKILHLNPFLDDQGILRVGSRLKNANIPFNQKYPIILRSTGHFTYLIIQECHQRTLHGGTQLTLNMIRKRYWVLNSRNVVRHQLHKCVKCFRYRAVVQQQLMGSLPNSRVNVSRPFLHTGVDFSGYINIKESKGRGRPKTSKGYICVFVCLCTKASHLEFVSDLTADAFLGAFRRFISRRGICSNMYSDCGTNFIGASEQLKISQLKHEYGINSKALNTLTKQGTQWHFIPPASPHFGGIWEAGVKSVKYHLKRVIGDTLLTFEEITTLLTQAEACLNSRPLCPLTDDPEECSALTPGHFLIGDALLSVPEPDYLDQNFSLLSRWQLIQRMNQDFWKRWLAEYLPRLQNRPKWVQQRQNLGVGNLVLLKDERLPPCKWLLGRIIELHPGQDGLVRVVTVKTKDAILKRPVVKTCLLPITDNNLM